MVYRRLGSNGAVIKLPGNVGFVTFRPKSESGPPALEINIISNLFVKLRRLYEKGLRPGDYWGENIVYWPDEGCQAMLDRIEREWVAAGEDPNLGEPICWLGRPDKQD